MDSVFQEIYEKYHTDLFQFIFYTVKSREITEDLVQEVYIRVLKSYHQFQGKSSLKTWLFSIARNVTIDYFRKEKGLKNKIYFYFDGKQNEVKDLHPIPEEIAIQNEKIKQLYQCLHTCTVDQRMVLIARFLQDMTIAETAALFGWTESKVKTTQHRALKAIKKKMEILAEKEGH